MLLKFLELFFNRENDVPCVHPICLIIIYVIFYIKNINKNRGK
jgi:hypothetical protein